MTFRWGVCALAGLALVPGPAAAGPAPAWQEDAALFLPVGGEAEPLFRQLLRRAREGDWPTAVDLAARLIDRYPDMVLPVPGQPNTFAGAADAVGEAIARWPAEGLAAWRRFADPMAERLLAKGDWDAVLVRTPAATATADALRRLADAALEAGQVGTAADCYDRLLARVPLAIPDAWVREPAPVVQRAAAAYAAAGLVGRLERLRELPLVAGGPPALRATVAAAIVRAGRAAAAPPARDWPTLAGDVARLGRGGAPVDLAVAHAWTEALPPLPGVQRGRASRLTYVRDWPRGQSRIWPQQLQRRYRPIEPVVADGVVIASSGMAVHAYELYTGRSVRDRYFTPPSGEEPNEEFDPCLVHTATRAGDALYVQVGIPTTDLENYMSWNITEPIPRRQLVCLDARTGGWRWAFGAGAGPAGDRLREASMVAPPLVAGGVAYSVARTGRGGLGEFWLVALDAADGTPRWRRRICDGGTELNMFGRPLREAVVSALALDGGLLYCGTNIGAVVACEAATGRIRWIVRYPVARIPHSANFEPEKRAPIWATAPPVVYGDVLLVAPTDSPALLALDRRTGAARWRFAAVRGDDEEIYHYLLGVTRGLAIVTGNRVAAIEAETGRLRWATPARPVDEGDEPAGRGALAGDRIYWPTPRHLRVLDLDGRELAAREWTTMGPDPRTVAPGNVVCVGGALVVAWLRGAQPGLTVLCDRTAVLAELETEARARPRDPAPLLTAAEVRLQVDEDPAFARVTLRRADERLRQLPAGAARQALATRARAAWLRCELAASTLALRRGRVDEALAALRAALATADEPAEQVRVLLQIANLHEGQADDAAVRQTLRRVADDLAAVPFAAVSTAEPVPAGLVALLRLAEYAQAQTGGAATHVATLQELLTRYPDTPMPRETGDGAPPETAGAWAETRLRAVLTRGGRRHYARFDAEARALLEGAGPDDAEAVLHALLTRYPHAEVLPEAVQRLAGALHAAGRHAAAADALRRWLPMAPDAAQAAAATWLLARCYEAQGMWAAARGVLERLREAHGHVRLSPGPDLPARPLRELVGERLADPAYAETRAVVLEPRVAPPLRALYAADLPADARLVPVRGGAAGAPRGLVLVARGGELAAHEARTAAVRWRADVGHGRVFDVVAGRQAWLVTTVRQVAAVDPADGRVRWRRTIPAAGTALWIGASRGLVVVTATPPDAPAETAVAAFDEASGQPLWEARVDATVRPHPVAEGDVVALWCIARARGRSQASVQVLDLLSGEPRFAADLGDASLADGTPPAFLADGTLGVVVGGAELRALDPQTGAVTWTHGLGDGGAHGDLLVGATQVVVRRAPAVGGDLAPALSAVDPRTRARVWDLAVRDLQPRAPLLLAGDDLLLVRVLPDRRLVCESWDARDVRALRWRGDLGPSQAQCSRLLVAQGHVVAVVNTPRGNSGRLDVSCLVFDRRTGKLVQDPLAPGGEYDQPPVAVLADDGTVVLQTGGLLAGLGGK